MLFCPANTAPICLVFFPFLLIRANLASVKDVMSPPSGATVERHRCATRKQQWQNVSKAASQQLQRFIVETTAHLVTRFALIISACQIDRVTFESEHRQPL